MLRHFIRPLQGGLTLFRGLGVCRPSARLCSTGQVEKPLSVGISQPNEAASAQTEFREPVWFWDEDEAKDVVGNKATEHFSFDPSKGIHQEPEDERLAFQKYVAKFGEAR